MASKWTCMHCGVEVAEKVTACELCTQLLVATDSALKNASRIGSNGAQLSACFQWLAKQGKK